MKKLFLPFYALMLLCSCNETLLDEMKTADDGDSDNIENNLNITAVTSQEALNVARNFFKSNEPLTVTKSGNFDKNATVQVKKLLNDNPSMYIVNYGVNNGFVIISATKKHQPILAYSEDNSFSLVEEIPIGLQNWFDETEDAIVRSENLPLDNEKIAENLNRWRQYDDAYSLKHEKNTPELRSSYIGNEAERRKVYQAKIIELNKQGDGFSYYPLERVKDMFPYQSDYQQVCNKANQMGSPYEFTIIGIKDRRSFKEVGPLLSTQWGQDSPYNDYCPNKYPAGCVAIAMAQIMKFHRHPVSYNWSNIPNTGATVNTKQLIYEIGKNVNMNYGKDGSSSTYNNAAKALEFYGYNVKIRDHQYSEVQNEILIYQRPVYMRGCKKNFIFSWDGHAWVCDGVRKRNVEIGYRIEYQVSNGGIYYTDDGDSEFSSGYGELYFSMNWGWAGKFNGWFNLNDVNVDNNNYQYARKNLFISKK